MFFKWNRRHFPDGLGGSAAEHESTDSPGGETHVSPHRDVLEHWRQCERRVIRAWHAWQAAADGHAANTRYGVFLRALEDEERAAAEIERRAANATGETSQVTVDVEAGAIPPSQR